MHIDINININIFIIIGTVVKLRRPIRQRPNFPGDGCAERLRSARPEVADLWPVFLIQQDVARLQVAVNNARFVGESHHGNEFGDND
jgi:hypothetical protein